jgi:hypothetical protein
MRCSIHFHQVYYLQARLRAYHYGGVKFGRQWKTLLLNTAIITTVKSFIEQAEGMLYKTFYGCHDFP